MSLASVRHRPGRWWCRAGAWILLLGAAVGAAAREEPTSGPPGNDPTATTPLARMTFARDYVPGTRDPSGQ